jgi:hypothetical protein
MSDPGSFDSRRWTGNYAAAPVAPASSRYNLPQGYGWPIICLFAVGALFLLGSPLVWAFSGSPLVLSRSVDQAIPLGLSACGAIAMAFAMRSRSGSFLASAIILAFGSIWFAANEYKFLHDLHADKTEQPATFLVEGVRYAGLGKGRRMVPEVELVGNGTGRFVMLAPSSFANQLVAKGSCLKLRVLRGPYGFLFADRVTVVDQTQGRPVSFADVQKYRQRCLQS